MKPRRSPGATATFGCALAVLLTTSPAQAGDDWPIAFSLQSESLGFAPARPHPAFALGTEVSWLGGRHYRLLQVFERSVVTSQQDRGFGSRQAVSRCWA